MIEMRTTPLPELLTITELIQQTRREIASFQRRQGADGGYGYELFRRAIVLRDDLAWSAIYELYHAVVGSWILSQARKPVGENFEALVNEAFARFAHAMNGEKWRDFACVSALIGYLKCCAKSAATDYCRWRQPRWHEDPLESLSSSQEPLSADCAESVMERLAAQEVWAIVFRATPLPEERLVLDLHIARGMHPRELQKRYPAIFPTVQEIYRIRRRVIERLQRNKELRRLHDGQSSREVRHAS